MDMKSKLDRIKKKMGRTLELLKSKELPISFNTKADRTKLNVLEIGKLTDEEMRRFNLGPYSKTSAPGSVSV